MNLNLERGEVLYMLELLNADIARMRQLVEHARSHGMRDYDIPEHTTALVIVDLLTPLAVTATAPPEPVGDVICLACGEAIPEAEHATHACLPPKPPKCDGEHVTAACADPQCWRRKPALESEREITDSEEQAFRAGYSWGVESSDGSTFNVAYALNEWRRGNTP